MLNDDNQAVLLLCSTVGASESSDARPLSAREWNELSRKISASTLGSAGALLGLGASQLVAELEIPPADAERIHQLLEDSGSVATELERLTSFGITAVTCVDDDYPPRLRESLKHVAPPVLFAAGKLALLNRGGVAVVGSRSVDERGKSFAEEIGRKCAELSVTVISGGARGTDAIAMGASLSEGGASLGVLADSLERAVRAPNLRDALEDGKLALVTPYSPSAGFSIGGAMGRNKLIYGFADYAVVVSSDVEKGGTWAGATEALKSGSCPVFVRMGDEVPAGNHALIKKGASPVAETDLKVIDDLLSWMKSRSGLAVTQPSLF
jgi:predicted Rossmann fold nucleotide-binding protein DprA/Smf involved in DNA uptake